MKIILTESEFQFVKDTLDSAREEFNELNKEKEWYVTDLDERCLAAYTIMKYAEKE